MDAPGDDSDRTIFEEAGWSGKSYRETTEHDKKTTKEQTAAVKKEIIWVIIYDNFADSRRYMKMEVDESSNANFITREMAADYRLKIRPLGSKPFRGKTIDEDVMCQEYATATLFGGNRDEHHYLDTDFYILPVNEPSNESRFEKAVACRHLLQKAGHLLLT